MLKLNILLLLNLLHVLHLLQLLSLLLLLLQNVGLRAESSALDPLVVHNLGQTLRRVAVVERRHHPVLASLVEASLASRSSPQRVELTRLAHGAVHPGQPVALAVQSALATRAGHGQVGEAGRQGVKLHASQLLLVRHHHVVHGQVRVGHALQVVQGHGGRLLERRGHHGRRRHVGDVAVRRLQRVDWRQDGRAVQEAAGLACILQVLLLHLHVFGLLAADDALGARLARLLALAGPLRQRRLLQAAQVAVGRAEGRRQRGAQRAAVHVGAAHQVVLVHQPHNVVMHPLLRDVPGQAVHVVGDLPVGKVVQQDLGSAVASFPGGQEQRGLLLRRTQRR